MSHLRPEQLVDLAEGVIAATSMPHLASCDACRRELADMRAMLTAVADPDCAVPEPSPLFWDHLSARVREAVVEERRNHEDTKITKTHEPGFVQDLFVYLRDLRVFEVPVLPLLGAALAALVVIAVWPRGPQAGNIPSRPLPIAGQTASLPSPAPIPPLGAADDPQLRIVAAYGAALGWDEMRDEMAVARPAGSADLVVGTLTPQEQRALQRLLANEMAQPSTLEDRS